MDTRTRIALGIAVFALLAGGMGLTAEGIRRSCEPLPPGFDPGVECDLVGISVWASLDTRLREAEWGLHEKGTLAAYRGHLYVNEREVDFAPLYEAK